MKKLIVLLLLSGALSAQAQKVTEKEVPQPVLAQFKKLYPAAKDAKWEKEEDGFEAEFKQGGEETSVVFDAAGALREVETEIAVAKLPQAVQKTLSKDYADYKVTEAAKILKGGKTLYEAEVKKGTLQMDLIFDDKGVLVKKKVEEKEKGENERD